MKRDSNQHLRVAFLHMDGSQWTGALHYLSNLFAALRSLGDDEQPEIVLLVSAQMRPDAYAQVVQYVNEVLVLPLDPLRLSFWQRQRTRVEKRLGIWQEPESHLSVFLREHRVDALFAACGFGPAFAVPLISWIPDFQHVRMPEMFSNEDIARRSEWYMRICEYADRVVLSSQDALHDLVAFSSAAVSKSQVLSFVSQVPSNIYASDPEWICGHYHLPQRFIYLPNQFWKHKNHHTVIQALATATAQEPELTIVCTGNTNDYRYPLYFGELLELISRLGLRQNLVILGLVPHDHIFQLIRQSVAVLQPSLFEGWSTTVEEVKSVGKSILLSDIPVHREQDPPQATYFAPCSADDLGGCLVNAFLSDRAGPDQRLESKARDLLPPRTLQFAQSFMEIVEAAIHAAPKRLG